ncbi:MAG: hypothetical protein V4497_01375 [Bacteroidota bacterium]
MESVNIIITSVIISVCFLAFCAGKFPHDPPKKEKKKKSKYPKCDCSDVNECSKWCHAKQAFNKDFQDGKI